jgi:hypothetical protein
MGSYDPPIERGRINSEAIGAPPSVGIVPSRRQSVGGVV